jgi:hypothetical protein
MNPNREEAIFDRSGVPGLAASVTRTCCLGTKMSVKS